MKLEVNYVTFFVWMFYRSLNTHLYPKHFSSSPVSINNTGVETRGLHIFCNNYVPELDLHYIFHNRYNIKKYMLVSSVAVTFFFIFPGQSVCFWGDIQPAICSSFWTKQCNFIKCNTEYNPTRSNRNNPAPEYTGPGVVCLCSETDVSALWTITETR